MNLDEFIAALEKLREMVKGKAAIFAECGRGFSFLSLHWDRIRGLLFCKAGAAIRRG